MSYRIAVLPLKTTISEEFDIFDAIIHEDDTPETIAGVVREWAWQAPLRIFAGDLSHDHVARLIQEFDDIGMTQADFSLEVL